uniref:Uncharacterized protein n=1 Tax=Anguilla anguilla TaxID=7936 RepID=A0A0E9PP78_ANGAN
MPPPKPSYMTVYQDLG